MVVTVICLRFVERIRDLPHALVEPAGRRGGADGDEQVAALVEIVDVLRHRGRGMELPPTARPVPPVLAAGNTGVSLCTSPYLSASNCSILSCAYSVVRAARWPWFSVKLVAIADIPMRPAMVTSRIAQAIVVSMSVVPRGRLEALNDESVLPGHHCFVHVAVDGLLLHNWTRPVAETVTP